MSDPYGYAINIVIAHNDSFYIFFAKFKYLYVSYLS